MNFYGVWKSLAMWAIDLPKNLLKLLIRGYGYVLSPWLGVNKCRFCPTCSHYALEALDRHGAIKGSVLALKRLMKCHPWYKGGMIDEVPSSIDWKGIMGYNSACKSKDMPD